MHPLECPLCDPQVIPERLYARLFEDYGWDIPRNMRAKSAAATARRLRRRGHHIGERDIWAHFAQHLYWRAQPTHHRRVSADRIERVTDRLSERQLAMADLVARVGCISSKQLRAVLYEPTSSPTVAQAAHGRDVRPLCHRHLLYRLHPEPEPMRVAKEHGIRSQQTFHLGRNGQVLAQVRQGIAPPFMRSARQITSYRMRHELEVNQIIIDLIGSARAQRLRVGGTVAHVGVAHENWFGPACIRMWFRNPISRRLERVRPDGLAALSLTVPERNIDALLPFFVMWDSGLEPVGDIVDELIRHGALQLTDVCARRIPLMGRETPPVVVIHENPRRLAAVSAALGRRVAGLGEPERPRVLATDAASFAAGAWEHPVMTDPVGDGPRLTFHAALVGALTQTRSRADVTSVSRLRLDLDAGARPPRRVLTAQRRAAAALPAAAQAGGGG